MIAKGLSLAVAPAMVSRANEVVSSERPYVAYWHLADIQGAGGNVRFQG
jgi:hypothetical protein